MKKMKNLRAKKAMAMKVLGVGKDRVWLDPERLQEIKEVVTKQDIAALIKEGIIKKKSIVGDKKRAHHKRLLRKKRGRRRGQGKKRKKIINSKRDYVKKIRKLRRYIRHCRSLLSEEDYRNTKKLIEGGQIRELKELKSKIGK